MDATHRAAAVASAVLGVLLLPVGLTTLRSLGPGLLLLVVAVALLAVVSDDGRELYRAVLRTSPARAATGVVAVVAFLAGAAFVGLTVDPMARLAGAGVALGSLLVGAWLWVLRPEDHTRRR